MAGALSFTETENVETSLTAIEAHWELEFSRFFNFPSPPLPSTSLVLKPLRKSTICRLRGTWLSSSSTASLHLLTYHWSPELVLVVSLRREIHSSVAVLPVFLPELSRSFHFYVEEHFISNLNFSWPQVSCVYQSPTKGSRVIFASYRDGEGQCHSFYPVDMLIVFAPFSGSAIGFEGLLRIYSFSFDFRSRSLLCVFSISSEAETFINILKERLKDMINIRYPQNNSKSEFFSSTELHCRDEEDTSQVSPDVINVNPPLTYSPQTLPLDCKTAQSTCSQQPEPACNIESILPTLPPSFTALLASCCTEPEQDIPKVPEEVDIVTQITRCMMDSSFNDMLIKVEKVISEMGGDLAI